MVTILISCLFGIGLSLAISWVLFKTDFVHKILKDILGQKQADDWHTRFNNLVGEKAQGFGIKIDSKTSQTAKSKTKWSEERPRNWQEEVFKNLKGSFDVVEFLKSIYTGDKAAIKKVSTMAKNDSKKAHSYLREVLAYEADFSFFNKNSVIDYLALRVFLMSFRENASQLKEDHDYALMGYYLSKCGISDKQLHEYWKKNKNSLYLKFKARSLTQALKVEQELAYQFKKISVLEKNILSFKLRIENYSPKSSKQNNKKQQKTKEKPQNLNPDKYQDALKIFDISSISSKSSLKKQYRKLAMQYHPDRVEGSDKAKAHKEFVQIQKAYETLQKFAA
jgi:curved DNA-binding protein CbpA